jgi:purine-cytosine permease-like protein
MVDIISVNAASTFIASIGSIISIGGIIAFIDFIYKRKRERFNSLFEAFTYLNTDKHREARRVLYYCIPKKGKEMKIRKKCDIVTSTWVILGSDISSRANLLNDREKLVRVSKDMVRDDMDQMGLMIKKN